MILKPPFLFLIVSMLMLSQLSQAQPKYTISGKVTDEESGEALIGATLYVKNWQVGAVTNNYGFFSLTLPETDSLMLVITFVGFKPQVKNIHLHKNITLNIRLVPGQLSLEEVVINATPPNENVERVQMAVMDVPIQQIEELPVILGESDILKVVQLLPGVQAGNARNYRILCTWG